MNTFIFYHLFDIDGLSSLILLTYINRIQIIVFWADIVVCWVKLLLEVPASQARVDMGLDCSASDPFSANASEEAVEEGVKP